MPSIVYDKQKLIYVAIEKCGITRLINYFGTTYKLTPEIAFWGNNRKIYKPEQIFYPATFVFPSDVPASKIKKEYPDCYVFSFIRNPFDRIVSNWFFAKGSWKKRFGREISFEEYCLNLKAWNFLPLISKYLDVEIDFIGKYENFKDDFNKLHNIIDIDVVKVDGIHPLERISNRSPWRTGKTGKKISYKEMYNENIKTVIEKIYKEDLERFNYKNVEV